MTNAVAAGLSGQHKLRLYAYKKSVAVGLIDDAGKEKIYHFMMWHGDDPVEEVIAASSALPHNLTLGLLNPFSIAGELVQERTRPQDKERFTWQVEFPISEAGFNMANEFAEGAHKWNYHVRRRNCVTFAHGMANAAGIKVSRPFVQRPTAFMARVRGALRRGRIKAKAGILPPGRLWGALPENLLPAPLAPA